MYRKPLTPKAFMSPGDADLLEEILNLQTKQGGIKVLEWGSGLSTSYYFKALCAKEVDVNWLSIESDRRFFERHVAPQLKDVRQFAVLSDIYRNLSMQLPSSNTTPALRVFVCDLGSLKPYGHNWRDRIVDPGPYVAFPTVLGEKFDVIIIDGRFRRRCLQAALSLLSPHGVVVLHDAWRRYYHGAMKCFPASSFIGEDLWIGSKNREAFFELMAKLPPQDPRARVVEVTTTDFITLDYVGRTVRVSDKTLEVPLKVSARMIGRCFGELNLRRRISLHITSWIRSQTRFWIPNARYCRFIP